MPDEPTLEKQRHIGNMHARVIEYVFVFLFGLIKMLASLPFLNLSWAISYRP